jgi:hypothetical protein
MNNNKHPNTPLAKVKITRNKDGSATISDLPIGRINEFQWRLKDIDYKAELARFLIAAEPDGADSWLWFGSYGLEENIHGYGLLLPFNNAAPVDGVFTVGGPERLEIFHLHWVGGPIAKMTFADRGEASVMIAPNTWTVTGTFSAMFMDLHLNPSGSFNLDMSNQ